ncbi:CGNR zinc finger domain-containing protein [Micromonospora costi]|uniref:Zf-CGNR multi-domain protein n=1 Tax=Micromonospora costi TaxID=1530042 RepID=A0A3B0AA80_9ACTN|nr:CGNR zinc finger domain-containing protein [Micromonospora costi]RKN57374.1 zf-CGNR multi-domain protein [Micromonospora costi]
MRQPGDRAPAPASLTLVQDLANTVDIEMARDALRTVDDLAAFCAAHGLPGLTVDAADLADAVRLREALRDVCQAHAGSDVPPDTLAALHALLRQGPLTVEFDAAGHARAVPAPGLTGLPALAAAVARSVLDAVADGTWPRLKACAAHSCRWVYYDRSPAGRSRWCTMSICGSRAKMRAYRGRNRPD